MNLVAWLVIVSAVVTTLGWIKQTWCFSVGYACSVVAMVGITGVVARDHLTPLAVSCRPHAKPALVRPAQGY